MYTNDRSVPVDGLRGVRVGVHGRDRQQVASQFVAAAGALHLHVRLQFPVGGHRLSGRRGGRHVGRLPLHLLAPAPYRQERAAPKNDRGPSPDAHRTQSGL